MILMYPLHEVLLSKWQHSRRQLTGSSMWPRLLPYANHLIDSILLLLQPINLSISYLFAIFWTEATHPCAVGTFVPFVVARISVLVVLTHRFGRRWIITWCIYSAVVDTYCFPMEISKHPDIDQLVSVDLWKSMLCGQFWCLRLEDVPCQWCCKYGETE